MGTIDEIREKYGDKAGDLVLTIGALQEIRNDLEGLNEKRDIDESIIKRQMQYENITGVPYANCRGYRNG